MTRRREKKRTSTGKLGIRLKKTASDAGASATRILSMSRASLEAVFLSGWTSPAVGLLRSSGIVMALLSQDSTPPVRILARLFRLAS